MRIAYTINGLIGGFVGKNSQTSDKSKDSTIILEYVSNLLRKNVIEPNNADVFIFSWHTDFEDEFNKFLNPTSMLLEEQIDFRIFDHIRKFHGFSEKRTIGHMSRWYGYKQVMSLVHNHERKNNIEYDLVVNARFDICWNRPFDFTKLSPKKFHIPWHPDIPDYGWPRKPEILDHVFASSSQIMRVYSTMYDKLYEYTLPGECPQWNGISNHFLMIWHLRWLGLLRFVEKTFGNWDKNNPKLDGGSEDDLEIAYDLFRYRKFTKDEVIELNDKASNI